MSYHKHLHRLRTPWLACFALLLGLALGLLGLHTRFTPSTAAAPAKAGRTQHLTSPDQTPAGVSATDWQGILATMKAAGHKLASSPATTAPTAVTAMAAIQGPAYFKPSPTADNLDYFGFGIAISGDTMVVAAPGDDGPTNAIESQGAIYVFRFVGGVWALEAKLFASNPGTIDGFGGPVGFALAGTNVFLNNGSVAIDGNTIVVGAPFEDGSGSGVNPAADDLGLNNGAAYVFTRVGTTWTQQAYLKASNPGLLDGFGWDVDVSGNTIVVGAPLEDSINRMIIPGAPNEAGVAPEFAGSEHGAAYVFKRTGTTWTQESYLKPPNITFVDYYGASVAVDGDKIIVGAFGDDGGSTGAQAAPPATDYDFFLNPFGTLSTNSGAAHVYSRAGTTWSYASYLKAFNIGTQNVNDYFGYSVDISGNTAIVGNIGEDSNTTSVNSVANELALDVGAAYTYTMGTPWTNGAYLKANHHTVVDYFGKEVSLNGTDVAVGAPGEDHAGNGINPPFIGLLGDSGAVYKFTGCAGTACAFDSYNKQTCPDVVGGFGNPGAPSPPSMFGNVEANNYFGNAVAVNMGTVGVGAPYEGATGTGVNPLYNLTAGDVGAAYIPGVGGCNTPPTITSMPQTVQQGSPATANAQIGTASDIEDAEDILQVQISSDGVNFFNTATLNGVTVTLNDQNAMATGINPNAMGQIFASVIASCTALNATFTLKVTDSGGAMDTKPLVITVTANTPPVLTYANQMVTAGGTDTVSPSTATDNGSIASYALVSQGTYTGTVGVNAMTGVVTLTNHMPVGTHTIMVKATDNCGAMTTASFTVTVTCPTITVTPPANNMGTMGVPLSEVFTQTGGIGAVMFMLNTGALPGGLTLAANGTLSGTPTQAGTFAFTVKVTDSKGCMGVGSAVFTLVIACGTLTIAPPSAPPVFTGTPYSLALTSGTGTAPFLFTLMSGPLPTGLTLGIGGLISGTATVTTGSFPIVVKVTDAAGCMGTQAYTLTVTCPTITVNPAGPALPAGMVGTAYSQTFTATGGFAGSATFSVSAGMLPPGLTLSGAGVLSGTPTQAGPFSFTVKATDTLGCMGTRAYTLTIAPAPLVLNPPTLPSGTFNVPYNQMVTATGGTPGYTFSLQSGSLPPGLTLNPDGTITGTPTAPGATTFTVKVTDAAGMMTTRTYTIGIQCPVININPAGLPNPVLGAPYSQTLTGTGGVGPYTFALGGGSLPAGLTLVGNLISGTPTALGASTFTINVTDTGLPIGPSLCGGNRTYTVTVVCPAITFGAASSLPNGVQGTAYSQSVAASPAGAYSYAVTSDILPPGLTLNAATGLITGIPTQPGNYDFRVSATGAGACNGSQYFNLLITGTCAAITLSPASLPAATIGAAYSQSLTVSPAGSYTFSYTGALPSGVTLDANTGVISGTPTATGSFVVTIKATGPGGCTGSRLYVLTVNCPAVFTFTPNTLPNGATGMPYSQTVSVAPAGSYTFSLLLGQLPLGYTLNAQTGVISGITNQRGTYNFTLKVRVGSCQATKAYTIVVTGSNAALAQLADYDGDGKADTTTWKANQGQWEIARSSDQQTQMLNWGTAGDVTLLGDYDGDGKSDLAVFRPSNGNWYVKHSSDGSVLAKAWGLGTDVPVPGDYDGDGKTDIAVFRPSEGNWYVLRSSDQQYEGTSWGAGYAPYDDVAVPGDYDGDGRTDLAVFRRATGTWYVKRSSDGQITAKAWGLGTDVPVAADYDGDGKTDFAVWRGSAWYIWQSTTDSYRATEWGANYAPYFDQAVPADYDGDGQADVAVWRASDQTWYIRSSQDGSVMAQAHGQAGSKPVSAHRP